MTDDFLGIETEGKEGMIEALTHIKNHKGYSVLFFFFFTLRMSPVGKKKAEFSSRKKLIEK